MSDSDDWLPTREAMAYVGVRRPESLPMWIDMPPANPHRVRATGKKYKRVRVEKRGTRKYYHRGDLDAYLEFKTKLAQKEVTLRTHKPVRICAECKRMWPCETYRRAQK